MDDVLPSYGEATTRDHWSIISSFVQSKDLCSAALVSKEWNQIFMPQLWGNPASHFGKESDAVYVALVRFKRILSWARLTTRELTHTLHFPPAQAELYDGPHSEWLQDILERLPKLQSLIVAQLPFFDHSALVRLDLPRPKSVAPATYSLRLLDASGCINTTPAGLAAAFQQFPALVYLDISGTVPARNSQVLSNLWRNPCLQILKARRLALTDLEVQILAQAVGTNLRSLDLRDNRLTDQSIRTLVENCIKPIEASPRLRSTGNDSPSSDLNSGFRPRTGAKILDVYKSVRQDDYIRVNLTTGFVHYLGIESISGSGITHLYISGNHISVEGISGLLRSKRLHVLDVGGVLRATKPMSLPSSKDTFAHAFSPGMEKLTPVLDTFSEDVTYLRINHAVVTKNAPEEKEVTELEDVSSILFPPNSVELDTIEQTVHEMPAYHINELTGDLPVYAELEGSPVPLKPQPDAELTGIALIRPTAVRTASSNAPELTLGPSPTLDASGGLFSPMSPLLDTPTHERSMSDLLSVPPLHPRKRTYSGVLGDHQAEMKMRRAQPHCLLPSMMPNLETLVLTDVPPRAKTQEPAKNIIQFIRDCATEAHWAKRQASVGYALPPGRDRRSAECQYARSLFPLRRVVLEMAPQEAEPRDWRPPSSSTYSSVLDPDCETFWTAAKDDFSFFGTEECGLPDADPAAHVPLAALTEKMVVVPDENGEPVRGSQTRVLETKTTLPAFDVLAEISRFRQERRREHEAGVARGNVNAYVEGYWDGDIVVIRPR